MTWVESLDKSVETLLLHIDNLKVKANDQIPSVMKLNPISKGVITQRSVQYLFKVGSSYYERDPNTLEEVDSKLNSIKLQAEQDKQKINAEAESNAAAIENNKKIVTKITQIMKDLGIPNNWSRSYYKTANSRKMTTETNQAGYIGDLSRNVPTSDDSAAKLRAVDDVVNAAVRHAETLKQKIRTEQQEKDKAEKAKKEVVAKARLQLKYGLTEYSGWDEVLEALDGKDKYFALARAGKETRSYWGEGFGKVEYALSKFEVETEEDKEIYKEYSDILEENANGNREDGRVFRDCEFNYSMLFGKVDEDLLRDYETLKEYYGEGY